MPRARACCRASWAGSPPRLKCIGEAGVAGRPHGIKDKSPFSNWPAKSPTRTMAAASRTETRAEAGVALWPWGSLRKRPSQPNVGSITDRWVWTAKPCWPGERRRFQRQRPSQPRCAESKWRPFRSGLSSFHGQRVDHHEATSVIDEVHVAVARLSVAVDAICRCQPVGANRRLRI